MNNLGHKDSVVTAGIGRRTLTKGAAWAVPALAVSTIVPAYASSECGGNGGLDLKVDTNDSVAYPSFTLAYTPDTSGQPYPVALEGQTISATYMLFVCPWGGQQPPSSYCWSVNPAAQAFVDQFLTVSVVKLPAPPSGLVDCFGHQPDATVQVTFTFNKDVYPADLKALGDSSTSFSAQLGTLVDCSTLSTTRSVTTYSADPVGEDRQGPCYDYSYWVMSFNNMQPKVVKGSAGCSVQSYQRDPQLYDNWNGARPAGTTSFC